MPCSGLRFLVVEDQEFQRNVLSNLLNRLGARDVHQADDGHSALRVLRDPDRPLDIVVSDLSMPGMDGMELIRNLSEIGSGVGLILVSSLDHDVLSSIANMAIAYKVQLLGVIAKPATAAKLVPLIEQFRSSKPSSAREDGIALGEIAEAWAHDEFEVWFEPRADLTTGAIRGFEATPRWRHPERGVLTPADFLPSVRSRGLNDDFAWMTVQKAVAECGRLRLQGEQVTVSVNLAFDALTDPNIATRIRHIADSAEVEPAAIVLGVTEAGLNTGSAKALENLARLRVLGFGLGLDDLGSGRMAVDQLSLVAFTELKIQSAFVTGAETDPSTRAGLAAGLEIAHDLKVKAIASGVSTKEDWVLLHEWGCDLGQGPFISPPLPPQALVQWLGRWTQSRLQ